MNGKVAMKRGLDLKNHVKNVQIIIYYINIFIFYF